MRNRLAALALALACGGCGRPPESPPVDTGARDAVRHFYDAVLQKDWPAAYSALQPKARKAWSSAEFARRGEAYRRHLGFDPTAVRVRACEERGDEATAHVELTGTGSGRHHFKDAIGLGRQDGQWFVIPPPKFGQK